MTTLIDAARQVVATQKMLRTPYVKTSRNAPTEREVAAGRRQSANDALETLAVAVAAHSWSCVQVDGVVHKVRMDGRIACDGSTTGGWEPRDPRSVLTVDNACPDCEWGLA